MRKKTRTTSNKKQGNGYVLIDVVVAMVIMSIAFFSIISGFVFAGRVAGDTYIKTAKTLVEKNEFEKLPWYEANDD